MDDDDNEDWEVEKILGVKRNLRKKKVECLIKWKSKPNNKNSWEELDRIPADKRDLLDPFDDAIDRLQANRRSLDDEEFEEKEMEQDEYVVEDILGIQWSLENARLEFFIKWDGWDNSYNNWEPEENLSCPELQEFFIHAGNHLKEMYCNSLTPSRGRAAPKSRKYASSESEDDEPSPPKRPGPKSKTKLEPAKRAGPKSKTSTSAIKPLASDSEDDAPKAKPGPKSKTASKPGPASTKRPGPASKRPGPASVKKSYVDSDEDDNTPAKRKAADSSDDEMTNSRNGNGNSKRKGSVSSGSDDEEPVVRRPGPKSAVRSDKPGPASKKMVGPKSKKTYADSGDDSD